MKYIAYTASSSPSLLRKAAGLIVAVAVAAAMLMFSAVVLAVVLVLGLAGAAWVWWKTRQMRKMMKQFRAQAANDGATFNGQRGSGEPAGPQAARGEVIEGEAVRVYDSRDGDPR